MSLGMTVYAYVSDLQRMRQFYESAPDIKPAFQSGNWLPFELRGATFALHGIPDGAVRDLQRFNLNFEIDDVDAAVARFAAYGAKVLRGAADEAFGRRAILQDPDGRQFEIVQHEMP